VRKLPAQLAQYGAELVSIEQAVKSCEIAIVLVSHDEFKMIPISERRHLEVMDTCGIWQDMPVRH
jgi:UDP-N-acetyl-D-mannosaminuronic acid dehydrogenase